MFLAAQYFPPPFQLRGIYEYAHPCGSIDRASGMHSMSESQGACIMCNIVVQ